MSPPAPAVAAPVIESVLMTAPATLAPPERRTVPAADPRPPRRSTRAENPPPPAPRSAPAAVPDAVSDAVSDADAVGPRFPAGAFPRPILLAEYHAMLAAGVFPNDGRQIELLDGLLSEKPVPEPLHSGTVRRIDKRLRRALPEGWEVRQQDAITLPDSEPLPDVAVVPDRDDLWFTRHPTAGECAVVIEVSDSTLRTDRGRKLRIYAAAGVTPYWIVNLIDRRVEVHDEPSPGDGIVDGTGANPPGYRRRDVSPGETLSLVMGDVTITLDAADLLPPVPQPPVPEPGEGAADPGGKEE